MERDVTPKEERLAMIVVEHEGAMQGALWLLEGVHAGPCDPTHPNGMCRACLAQLGLRERLAATRRVV